MESNQRPPACNSTALAPRAIYDTEGGRRVNNTILFSSVVLLRPHTPGSGLCRSVFSRPVCLYAIVTFDPVTRDVTILPGAVPAGAARPAHSLGGGGRPRWGGAAPNTPDGWVHVFRVSLQRMDRMGRTDQLVATQTCATWPLTPLRSLGVPRRSMPRMLDSQGWFSLASGRPFSGPIRARTGPERSFPLAARTWNF